MEETTFPNFENAVWYKLEKDRTVQLIPVFTDYNVSTRMGVMLYDKDMVPCKLSSELPTQYSDDLRAWYLNLDFEDLASMQAAGIIIPAEIETAGSLNQVRAMFNRKKNPLH